MQRPTRATIKDVAKAAGVSPTTVSHALSGKGVVRKETKEHVRSIAAQIGYRPSPLASGLRRNQMGLVALVIRPLEALDTSLLPGVDYFFNIAGFASLTAIDHGYNLMIVDDPSKSEAPFSALAADVYVIIEPYKNDHIITHLANANIPLIAVGADTARRDEFITMETGTHEQVIQMLEHLQSSGAQRIALVTGTDSNAWNIDARQTYLEWCEEDGQDPLITSVPEAEGERAGNIVLDRFFTPEVEAPDAIVCLLARQASGVTQAAVKRGISVPNELLVAACSEALKLQTLHPTVTAFDLQPGLLAQRAVEAAIALIEGKPIEKPLQAPKALLRKRESTQRH